MGTLRLHWRHGGDVFVARIVQSLVEYELELAFFGTCIPGWESIDKRRSTRDCGVKLPVARKWLLSARPETCRSQEPVTVHRASRAKTLKFAPDLWHQRFARDWRIYFAGSESSLMNTAPAAAFRAAFQVDARNKGRA